MKWRGKLQRYVRKKVLGKKQNTYDRGVLGAFKETAKRWVWLKQTCIMENTVRDEMEKKASAKSRSVSEAVRPLDILYVSQKPIREFWAAECAHL